MIVIISPCALTSSIVQPAHIAMTNHKAAMDMTGITGESVLVRLSGIDFPHSFPPDYMHLFEENVGPDMVKHYRGVLFKPGATVRTENSSVSVDIASRDPVNDEDEVVAEDKGPDDDDMDAEDRDPEDEDMDAEDSDPEGEDVIGRKRKRGSKQAARRRVRRNVAFAPVPAPGKKDKFRTAEFFRVADIFRIRHPAVAKRCLDCTKLLVSIASDGGLEDPIHASTQSPPVLSVTDFVAGAVSSQRTGQAGGLPAVKSYTFDIPETAVDDVPDVDVEPVFGARGIRLKRRCG